jgi:hypothetical protein
MTIWPMVDLLLRSWVERLISPVLTNWPLIAVAIWGILVARSTLIAIERQALSMRRQTTHLRRSVIFARRSANAAKASADALINAERPWITASVVKTVKNIPMIRNGESLGTFESVSFFDFVLKNHGRTPAEIFAVKAKTERTKNGIDGGFTDEGKPDYGVGELRHVSLLAPNETWGPDLFDINLYVRGDPNRPEIMDSKLYVIFWGVILYRDQFRPDVHETRFCYTYLSALDDYRPSGPRQYTRYT